MLTNRPVLTEQVQAIGLVTALAQPDELAAALNRTVDKRSPVWTGR